MALRRTIEARPDLIAARGGISDEERRLLEAEETVPAPADTSSVTDRSGGGPPGR
jgi:hypothetical protein